MSWNKIKKVALAILLLIVVFIVVVLATGIGKELSKYLIGDAAGKDTIGSEEFVNKLADELNKNVPKMVDI